VLHASIHQNKDIVEIRNILWLIKNVYGLVTVNIMRLGNTLKAPYLAYKALLFAK